jgi:hypothetical protein
MRTRIRRIPVATLWLVIPLEIAAFVAGPGALGDAALATLLLLLAAVYVSALDVQRGSIPVSLTINTAAWRAR